MNKNVEKIGFFLTTSFSFWALKFLKLGLCISSKVLNFSFINILGPVLAINTGISNLLLLIMFSSVFKFLGYNLLAFAGLTLGLPTIFASLTLKSLLKRKNSIYSFMLSVLLPIVCIFFFMLSPSAIGIAKLYSAYWLVPVFSFFIINNLNSSNINLFLISLSSTFVAHAIGSIIWAFSVNMSPENWISLIPIVAAERIIFASGISFSYLFINKVKVFFETGFINKENILSTNF